MLTLIVNSYPKETEEKIRNYIELVKPFSDYEVIEDKKIESNFDTSHFNAAILSGSPDFISKGEYCREYLEFLKGIEIPVLGIMLWSSDARHSF